MKICVKTDFHTGGWRAVWSSCFSDLLPLTVDRHSQFLSSGRGGQLSDLHKLTVVKEKTGLYSRHSLQQKLVLTTFCVT